MLKYILGRNSLAIVGLLLALCSSSPAALASEVGDKIIGASMHITFGPTVSTFRNSYKEYGQLDSEEAAMCMIRNGQTTPFLRAVTQKYQAGVDPRAIFEGLSDEEIQGIMNLLETFSY